MEYEIIMTVLSLINQQNNIIPCKKWTFLAENDQPNKSPPELNLSSIQEDLFLSDFFTLNLANNR
jgi:hypothetical protein